MTSETPRSLPTIGTLDVQRAVDRPDLVAEPVLRALTAWDRGGEVSVIEIDPDLADTAALTEAYQLPLEASANCVVVAGRRAGDERIAACVVTANTRADVNNLVKRSLDVRKASFLSTDRAVAETGMEYGGITPIGLPDEWRVFVDTPIAQVEVAMIGSGVRRSKLMLRGSDLAAYPGVELIEGLGLPVTGAS
jgi:prolyl-tRNA editing enzyme YbaK/EbsC (Cys-tRNA(Pro) deacylase)